MEQQIQIEGMTCQNCRQYVQNKLSAIDGVTNVQVDLENGSALFQTTGLLDTINIQNWLGEKYAVFHHDNLTQQHAPSKWKQLRPLFMIFN